MVVVITTMDNQVSDILLISLHHKRLHILLLIILLLHKQHAVNITLYFQQVMVKFIVVVVISMDNQVMESMVMTHIEGKHQKRLHILLIMVLILHGLIVEAKTQYLFQMMEKFIVAVAMIMDNWVLMILHLEIYQNILYFSMVSNLHRQHVVLTTLCFQQVIIMFIVVVLIVADNQDQM